MQIPRVNSSHENARKDTITERNKTQAARRYNTVNTMVAKRQNNGENPIMETGKPTWNTINELCDIVRETSFAIHGYLRSGHLEKVYENALTNRLRKHGLEVLQQYPLQVHDEDGTILGQYYADLFIEGCLVVELKAARMIDNEHIAQLLGYLRTSRMETGLLINFGAQKRYIKKFLMSETHT